MRGSVARYLGEVLANGVVVDGYRIERVIGTGRMGTIYLARNPDLPRDDALKVLNAELFEDPGFRDRFAQEAATAASLTHPNIVTVYRRGTTEDGIAWIAMQYVPGTDADTALRAGTMTAARAVHIITEIGKALDYAHRRGVIHRDVKPANFLLSTEDDGDGEHVLLGDFGIAHALGHSPLDQDAPVLATIAYAAPEVLRGGEVDGRADLYSLGCSLFRLLTGRTPFPVGNDPAAAARQHLSSPPPKVTDVAAELSPEFDLVISRAMAKDPRVRFQSGKELAAAAAAALAKPAPSAVPLDPWDFRAEPTASWRPSTRQVQIGGAAAAAAVLGGGLIWMLSAGGGDQPAPTEQVAAPTTPSVTRNAAAEAELLRRLPDGYPAGACTAVDPDQGARATVTCTANRDRGGPSTSRYSLMPDRDALQRAFDTIVSQSTVQICPGNIMSPGAWRHNATPDQVAGTVFCGAQGANPLVGWTSDDQLLLNIANSAANGPTLDQLYAWWSTHS